MVFREGEKPTGLKPLGPKTVMGPVVIVPRINYSL
jgi:hypothetical protein